MENEPYGLLAAGETGRAAMAIICLEGDTALSDAER